MAQIAEDLFLLLLDNASAQPSLERDRCERVLAGAALLDLAYACRIRPTVPGDAIEAGRLIALEGDGTLDPLAAPAYQLLQQRPLTAAVAVSKLRRHAVAGAAQHLEMLGEIRRTPVPAGRFKSGTGYPLTRRDRVSMARAALLAALFEGRPPTPATAGIVTLLHAVDGLGALLSLNDRGWRWVHARATEISSGSWVDEHLGAPGPRSTALPETNLAVTASVVRAALT